jgi:hypothetical protein
MRFIKGETLKEAIRRFHEAGMAGADARQRRLALRQLLGQFVALCNAVAYAHSRGVIHRDLTPANAMLGKFGETLLVDWGLAKVEGRPPQDDTYTESTVQPEGSSSTVTQLGQALGTPAYMSPEQARGDWNVVGPATDIYGLGAILYALLTGRAPVEGKDRDEVRQKVLRGEWRPPRQVQKDTPGALDAICRKALALRPEDRYASALDLAADVEHWLADEPVSAWREPLRLRAGRWARRHQALVAAVAAGVLVTILAGGTGLWWLQRQWSEQQAEAARQEGAAPRRRGCPGAGGRLPPSRPLRRGGPGAGAGPQSPGAGGARRPARAGGAGAGRYRSGERAGRGPPPGSVRRRGEAR